MKEATAIFINPDAHHRRTGRRWMACQRECLSVLAPAEVTLVSDAAHAARSAREHALRGYRKLIAVGGPETVHGLINGVMELAESHRRHLKLGVLNVTHAEPWGRSLGHPARLRRQLEVLAAGHTLPVDLGRLEAHDASGNPLVSYFATGVALGLTAQLRTDWRASDLKLLGTLSHLAAALRGACSADAPRVRLESENGVLFQGPLAVALLMAARHYPGLGSPAPLATPNDGLLHLTALGTAPPLTLLRRLAAVMLGRQRASTGLTTGQTAGQVRATVWGKMPVYVEADGEPCGFLPATISVLPRAVRVLTASVAVRSGEPLPVKSRAARGRRLVGNIKAGNAKSSEGP